MTKKSFKEGSESEAAPVDQGELELLSDADETLPVPTTKNVALTFGSVSGETSSRDLIIPRFDLVQGVGDLSAEFTPGDFVLNREIKLTKAGDLLHMNVINIRKFYEENLKFSKDGPRPQIWDTEEELQKAGMTLNYGKNSEPPTAREVGVLLIAIHKPEDVSPVSFSYELGKDKFALALWTVRKTAYRRVYKKVYSASCMELKRAGLPSGVWELSSERENINGNWVYVPALRLVSHLSKEEVETLRAAVQQS